VLGHGLDGIGRVSCFLRRVCSVVADDRHWPEPLPTVTATVIAEAARNSGAKTILGLPRRLAKTSWPRAAALLDAPMVTDVVAIEEMDGSVPTDAPSTPQHVRRGQGGG